MIKSLFLKVVLAGGLIILLSVFLAVFLARRLTDQIAVATRDIQQVVAEMQASVSTGVM